MQGIHCKGKESALKEYLYVGMTVQEVVYCIKLCLFLVSSAVAEHYTIITLVYVFLCVSH